MSDFLDNERKKQYEWEQFLEDDKFVKMLKRVMKKEKLDELLLDKWRDNEVDNK